ncbi:MAG TPA: Gfo/Idh/MocA family oxidoreductase [Phycisphaerae bacterium]|nr:Gfo/Idh/MocA family oxidoreductase [Phycisphaerae bacterium]
MESWKRRLRMGMVGGGQGAFIGAVHRIAAALDQQIELVAGCFSRDPANTKLTGAQLYLDPARCYDSFQAMAEAEARLPADKRIDFVAIVTPNAAHYPAAVAFLDAGIHVVCDKPMTCSIEEAEDLVTRVEKTGLVFALTHNYTAHPLIRHARELFRSGRMGTVRKVVAEYLQDWLARPVERDGSKQAGWRTDPAQSGVGGALGDIGSHAFNLAEYVTGERVVELSCDKTTFVQGRRLDDDANILLRFAGGAKGILTCSQIATGEENALKLRVYAAEGGIAWEQENPNYMKLYRLGEPVRTLGRGHCDYLTPEAMAVTRTPAGHPEGYLEAFATLYVGAVEAIRRHIDGKPMPTADYRFPTVHDGLRGVKFIHRAVESAQKGGVWVTL